MSNFSDVPADSYYAKAVAWAVENGITTGTGDGSKFSPDATCTRAQSVIFPVPCLQGFREWRTRFQRCCGNRLLRRSREVGYG